MPDELTVNFMLRTTKQRLGRKFYARGRKLPWNKHGKVCFRAPFVGHTNRLVQGGTPRETP